MPSYLKVRACIYAHIVIISACAQVRHNLPRQQSRVSRWHKHKCTYRLDSTIDGSVEFITSKSHIHPLFAVFSPQSLDELKSAVDTCVQVSDRRYPGWLANWCVTRICHEQDAEHMSYIFHTYFSGKCRARWQHWLLLFQVCVYFAVHVCTLHGTQYWHALYPM